MLNLSTQNLNNAVLGEVVKVKYLGQQDYSPVWQQMQSYNRNRTAHTIDEIWFLQHNAVYTQGQAGKPEHLLNTANIPVVQSDRGGQVTYHGPGQLIVYFLTDLQRKNIGIRQFVCLLEDAVIELLAAYGITAAGDRAAPGVYVNKAKICALGLRVRHGRTYHGLSLNVAMDLEPFSRINPCGYAGMPIAQMQDFVAKINIDVVTSQLKTILIQKIAYAGITT